MEWGETPRVPGAVSEREVRSIEGFGPKGRHCMTEGVMWEGRTCPAGGIPPYRESEDLPSFSAEARRAPACAPASTEIGCTAALRGQYARFFRRRLQKRPKPPVYLYGRGFFPKKVNNFSLNRLNNQRPVLNNKFAEGAV